MSNLPPDSPGEQQPWGTPPPSGPSGGWAQPSGGWGQPSGEPGQAGGPPYGSQPGPGGQAPYGNQQLPNYGQFGSQQQDWAPTAATTGELATWGPRVGAYLIDTLIIVIPDIILDVIGGATGARLFGLLGDLWVVVFGVWFAIQVGQTGASPGMRVVGLKCINKNTGQTIGGGLGFVRSLAHIVDSIICYVGFLFPLWDKQRQTLADKIMSTVVVRAPSQGFSLTPKSGR